MAPKGKKNALTYKHFVEALRSGQGDHAIICANGPSGYLKAKVEEWFSKSHRKSQEVTKRSADGISKADFDEYAYQDSIFEPQSTFIIRGIDKHGEISQALKALESKDSIKNNILLLAKNKSFPAYIQKELTRLGVKTIPCYEPNLYELPKFIVSLAKKHSVKIDLQGAQLIIKSVGTDLFTVENEIRKLSLIFADCSETLSADQLAPYLDCLKEEHAFKLDQSLISGNIATAQALLHDLLRRGESHLAILGILAHHCRKALQVYYLNKEGKQVREISQAIGLPFNIVKNYIPYARKSSPQKFKTALFQCQEADIIFKTSRIQSEIILSDVITTLAAG